jgi:carnosine N-methyltransferase
MRLQGQQVPEAHLDLVDRASFETRAAVLEKCAAANANFVEACAEYVKEEWWPRSMGCAYTDLSADLSDAIGPDDEASLNTFEMTLTSIVREWSSEGVAARTSTFTPLVKALTAYLPVTAANKYTQKVLVPGSGLGRLGLDCAAAGFDVEVNELDVLQVLVADFILTQGDADEPFELYPFFSEPCNHACWEDRVRVVRVPDITPYELLGGLPRTNGSGGGGGGDDDDGGGDDESDLAPYETAVGDFTALYGEQADSSKADGGEENDSEDEDGEGFVPSNAGTFDAVAGSFFVDTSPLVFEYIKAMRRVLKPGGLWCNLGPLEWAWGSQGEPAWALLAADAKGEGDKRLAGAVDLAWPDLKAAIERAGFSFLEEEIRDSCRYKGDNKSLVQFEFRCIYFVARRT